MLIRQLAVLMALILGLFFAGGAFSQYENQQAVNESIQKGVEFLKSQPNYDSEILALYLINEKHPELGLSTDIQLKVEKTSDFHYPIKQFVQGNVVDSAQVGENSKNAEFYSDFIGLFSCQPLTQEWVNSIQSLNEDESAFGSYKESHALLLLHLLKKDYLNGRCGNNPEFEKILTDAVSFKAVQLQGHLEYKGNFDSWVEKVAVLGYTGFTVSQGQVDFVLSQQSGNGGWKPAAYYDVNEESPHTTALAVWALLEASK